MPTKLIVQAPNAATKDEREAWARRVLDYFGDKLTTRRLLVYLDDEDWREFRKAYGDANRGLFSATDRFSYYHHIAWPPGMAEMLVCLDSTLKANFPYDFGIYLYDSTCHEEVSLTMTLAHELQHSIQREIDFNTWAFNTLVLNLRQETTAACELLWEDIPTERDARIVAKRVTERLVGRDKTDLYIEQRLGEATKDIDVADWNFIRKVDTSEPYNDLVGETRRLFQRLAPVRAELENILLAAKEDPEMAGLDLSMVMDDI